MRDAKVWRKVKRDFIKKLLLGSVKEVIRNCQIECNPI